MTMRPGVRAVGLPLTLQDREFLVMTALVVKLASYDKYVCRPKYGAAITWSALQM